MGERPREDHHGPRIDAGMPSMVRQAPIGTPWVRLAPPGPAAPTTPDSARGLHERDPGADHQDTSLSRPLALFPRSCASSCDEGKEVGLWRCRINPSRP